MKWKTTQDWLLRGQTTNIIRVQRNEEITTGWCRKAFMKETYLFIDLIIH